MKKSLKLKVSISKTCHQNIKFEKAAAKKKQRQFYSKLTYKKNLTEILKKKLYILILKKL